MSYITHQNKICIQMYYLRGLQKDGRIVSTRNMFLEQPVQSLLEAGWAKRTLSFKCIKFLPQITMATTKGTSYK